MFNLKPSLARQHSVEGQPRHRVNSPLSHHRGLDTPPAESAEEEVIMNEAHPLIANRDDSSKDMTNYYDGGDNTDPTVQALEISISYGIFFILGACVLLPWNALIVASHYLRLRLTGSLFESSFASWLPVSYTVSNLVFLGIANSTQQRANLTHRVTLAIGVIGLTLAGFLVSTFVPDIQPTLAFFILMISTIILGGGASYLHGAITAISSRFGTSYLQATLSGQGGVGLAVALTQFIIAYTVSTRSTNEIEPLATPQEMRTSAFHFFLIVTSFAVIGLISNFILITLPHYRSVIKDAASTQAPAEHEVSKISPTSFQDVNAKVRPLGIALFYVFFITLAVFPSITGSIVSVTDQSTTSALGTGGGLGETLSKTELFIPLGFVVFAAGDWIGRAMPQIELFVIHDWKILSVCSAARTVFIPLFLMCNVHPASIGGVVVEPFVNSDLVFMSIMFLFSLSNGYISTLLMLSAIVDPSLDVTEIPIAATLLAFYLTGGLAMGSTVSFPVRAYICQCNPFLN